MMVVEIHLLMPKIHMVPGILRTSEEENIIFGLYDSSKKKYLRARMKNKTTTMIVLALHKHNFSTSEENNIANVWPLNNNYIGFFSAPAQKKKKKLALSITTLAFLSA